MVPGLAVPTKNKLNNKLIVLLTLNPALTLIMRAGGIHWLAFGFRNKTPKGMSLSFYY